MTHYELMIEYLKQKVELKDWHAVWDAAIDLKCIEERGENEPTADPSAH
jgi:hypothetical protein